MEIDCKALGCMECCKRYWISVFPKEEKKAAFLLEKTEKDFLEKHCLLQAQLYPAPQKSKNRLIIPLTRIPKKFHSKIKKETGFLPEFFLVLPTIVFKRNKKSCEFLNQKNGLCKIYSVRPEQCRLFPFISFTERPLKKQYPFCAFLQKKNPKKDFSASLKKQLKKTKEYFELVEKNGFRKTWAFFPKKGFLRLDTFFLGNISKKDFFILLGD